MSEREIQNALCAILSSAQMESSRLTRVPVSWGAKSIGTLADWVNGIFYDVLEETSDWNPHARLMVDLTGGLAVDIALRSRVSGENRIYIEVKETDDLHCGTVASQIVRYFLCMLATTRRNTGQRDMRRAVLLAAPSSWFEREDRKAESKWKYFLTTYQPLADEFGITLGEIRTDRLIPA
jgi:hypothetical protein